MRITDYRSRELHLDDFAIGPGQAWCLFGSNTSGISSLIELLADPPRNLPGLALPQAELLSFARQQQIFEDELQKDDTDYLDYLDPGTPAREFIADLERHRRLIDSLNLNDCLDKGYRQLSSGESRKLLLIGSLSRNPELLIVENPYDGIDRQGCRELDAIFTGLRDTRRRILVTVNNPSDIPRWCTHVGVLQRGRLVLQGPRAQVVRQIARLGEEKSALSLQVDLQEQAAAPAEEELVDLVDGHARYGDRCVFSNLRLHVTSGCHTLITGANGSGKSTLLHIITGDNQNCYANDLRLFGRRRGSGESIWEIKRHMGIVTPELHRHHYIPGSALQVVLSGLFDSIGVYRTYTPWQRDKALRWLAMAGLAQRSSTPFRRLSFAEQRLCLIARALIKMPKLLILDEPTQGLDHLNRDGLLAFLETVAHRRLSTILYASHRSDEFRGFFRQHLRLGET